MLKMSVAVYRREDLTREEFLHHWFHIHAPLAERYADALRIRKYVQLHGEEITSVLLMTESRGCQPPHDGVVQIWWDSEEDRLAGSKSPEGVIGGQLLKEDELRFCDMSKATVIFGSEHVIFDRT